MANRAATESIPAAVCEDLLASLPPELVINVLSYLDSEDAVRCLAVNKL